MWLWKLLDASGPDRRTRICNDTAILDVGMLANSSNFDSNDLDALRGRSVLIRCHDQLAASLALIELDGFARRIVLLPPGIAEEHLPEILRNADIDACVIGYNDPALAPGFAGICIRQLGELRATTTERAAFFETEWVLLTSGTTGAPKLVLHTLASLVAFFVREGGSRDIHWATFYDIRRYGGLQIFLRAMYGGSIVLSSPKESLLDFAARINRASATHVTGTPSHWRKLLMSGVCSEIKPEYVRISGEIADQTLLDSLRAAFPGALVAHAFASTEAGVGFEIEDGLAGFPTSLVKTAGQTTIDVKDGRLRIRSPGNAQGYLGDGAPQLKDSEGFVPTGDQLEIANGRYRFIGRSGGVINVGGLKVHPEEVEAVINMHPRVSMSLVKGRRSPITGAIVIADIVLTEAGKSVGETAEIVSREILAACSRVLPAHKVPTRIKIVPALEMTASGKLVRPYA
jgi:acyl-coenzyme A synthetase/AMP-(fatty) acid ligase